VLVIWECETKNEALTTERLHAFLGPLSPCEQNKNPAAGN
jgi:G:T-mismatch repair DNA endonuclease (very short patch repair protein)